MDSLTEQAESSYRTLRKVVNTVATVIFVTLFAGVAYGFYNFHVSSLDIGEHLKLSADVVEGEHYTGDNAPAIVIHYRGIPSNTIKAVLDGTELKLTRQGIWGTYMGQAPILDDGKHSIDIVAGPYRQTWGFTVDTDVPTMDLRGPIDGAIISKEALTFYGTTKPQSCLVLKSNEHTSRHEIGEDGTFNFMVPIAHGINDLRWSVIDRAGNSVAGSRSVICDMTVPSIEPLICSLDDVEQASPKNDGYEFSSRNLVLKLTVKDPDSGIKATSYQLDKRNPVNLEIPESSEVDGNDDSAEKNSSDKEQTVEEIPEDVATSIEDASFIQTQATPSEPIEAMPDDEDGPTVAEQAPIGTADDENQATATMEDSPNARKELKPLEETTVTSLPVKGKALISGARGRATQYAIPLNELYDGDHTLVVTSVNGVKLSNKRILKFNVNSTDKFGEATMYLGAKGKKVKELQSRLKSRGYLTGDFEDGVYDEATKQAVIALQHHIGVNQDGVTGPMVYGAIDKRIYVNLAQYEAKLVTEDDKIHTYQIAIGVDEHPTPTGWFYIADKAKDPTWLPPNSEWAKDAKAIDPGPDNPLGTRWIGLDNSAIGFHGTMYPDSIGTKASHGCMRMRLPDVEDLYDRVTVGTQVRIYSGTEDDAILHQYWP